MQLLKENILNPKGVYILIVLIVFFLSIVDSVSTKRVAQSLRSDFWEHSAVIKTWHRDILNPPSPHVDSNATSARYMPYFFVVALTAKYLHLDPINALYIFNIINSILFCLTWGVFFRRYFEWNWAPAIGLLTMLTCWGNAWYWSNAYQLSSLVTLSMYPSTFTLAITPLLWLVAIKEPSSGVYLFLDMLITTFLVALVVLCHILTSILTVLGFILFVLTNKKSPKEFKIILVVCILLGLILANFWPFYNIIELIRNGSSNSLVINKQTRDSISRMKRLYKSNSYYNPHSIVKSFSLMKRLSRMKRLYKKSNYFYNPHSIVKSLWPAFIGIFLFFNFIVRKRHLALVFGLFLLIAMYILNLFIRLPLGHRYLLLAIVFMHLLIVASIVDVFKIGWGEAVKKYGKTVCYATVISIICIFIGSMLNISLSYKMNKRHATYRLIEKYRQITSYLENDSIVIGEPKDMWPIPTFTGKVVFGLHPNPFVKDRRERNHAIKDFFDEKTDDIKRRKIITRYKVTHVLLNEDNMGQKVNRFIEKNARHLVTVKNLSLFSLK